MVEVSAAPVAPISSLQDHQYHSMIDVLRRPILINNGVTGSADASPLGIAFRPNYLAIGPGAFLTNTTVSNILDLFKLYKATFVFRLDITKSKFASGILNGCVYPEYFGMDPEEMVSRLHYPGITMLDNVSMDITNTQSMTVKIPFMSEVSHYKTGEQVNHAVLYWWKAAYNVDGVSSAQDCSVQVYCHMEDVELAVPQSKPSLWNTSTPQVSYFGENARFQSMSQETKPEKLSGLNVGVGASVSSGYSVPDACPNFLVSNVILGEDEIRIPVHPHPLDDLSTQVDGYEPANLPFLNSSNFKTFSYTKWNGTIKYNFEFSKSQMVTGKVAVVYDPALEPAPFSLDNLNRLHHKIFDMTTTTDLVNEEEDYSFVVPWSSELASRSTLKWKTGVDGSVGYVPASELNGYLIIKVLTPLKSYLDPNPRVQMLVEQDNSAVHYTDPVLQLELTNSSVDPPLPSGIFEYTIPLDDIKLGARMKVKLSPNINEGIIWVEGAAESLGIRLYDQGSTSELQALGMFTAGQIIELNPYYVDGYSKPFFDLILNKYVPRGEEGTTLHFMWAGSFMETFTYVNHDNEEVVVSFEDLSTGGLNLRQVDISFDAAGSYEVDVGDCLDVMVLPQSLKENADFVDLEAFANYQGTRDLFLAVVGDRTSAEYGSPLYVRTDDVMNIDVDAPFGITLVKTIGAGSKYSRQRAQANHAIVRHLCRYCVMRIEAGPNEDVVEYCACRKDPRNAAIRTATFQMNAIPSPPQKLGELALLPMRTVYDDSEERSSKIIVDHPIYNKAVNKQSSFFDIIQGFYTYRSGDISAEIALGGSKSGYNRSAHIYKTVTSLDYTSVNALPVDSRTRPFTRMDGFQGPKQQLLLPWESVKFRHNNLRSDYDNQQGVCIIGADNISITVVPSTNYKLEVPTSPPMMSLITPPATATFQCAITKMIPILATCITASLAVLPDLVKLEEVQYGQIMTAIDELDVSIDLDGVVLDADLGQLENLTEITNQLLTDLDVNSEANFNQLIAANNVNLKNLEATLAGLNDKMETFLTGPYYDQNEAYFNFKFERMFDKLDNIFDANEKVSNWKATFIGRLEEFNTVFTSIENLVNVIQALQVSKLTGLVDLSTESNTLLGELRSLITESNTLQSTSNSELAKIVSWTELGTFREKVHLAMEGTGIIGSTNFDGLCDLVPFACAGEVETFIEGIS